ncbi:MAG: serine hydrolase, partial [Smithella sp.]
KSSGYNGVSIKNVLQMSSGVRFNEDYGDFNSDINRMGRYFALNMPLADFVASLKAERKPGTFHHYVSMDTQVLGMILRAATGKTLSEYTEEKLWKPLGMESDAYWLIDSSGMEAAFGGLNVTLRDYARFGRLYLKNGNWNGKQIIPEAWCKASVTPDAPHLMPGKRSNASWVLGYGYQWWIPENPDGDYLAFGIYGQAIYVYPRYNIVIAKTSAYSDYNKDGEDMEIESIEVFRTIARNLGR